VIRTAMMMVLVAATAPALAQPEPRAGEAPADVTPAPPTVEGPPSASPPDPTADRRPAPPPAGATASATEPAARGAASLPPVFAPWPTSRLALELELTSHARYASKAGTNLSELRLDRGELGARISLGRQAAAELRVEAIRSALEGGALGIDGDSTVVRVKYASVGGGATFGPLALDGAFGFTPDPWIRTLEDGYTLKPLSRTGSERLLGWATSDLAGVVRAAVGPARLSVAVGNGEGPRYPERNTGKTSTAVAEVVAVNQPSLRVLVAAVGRDGSIGVARVRDRRAGGGATVSTPWGRAGAEVIKAWGIGDRGDAEGLEVGGWLDARIVERVFVAARGASLGFTGGGRLSTFGGAIAVEPWGDGGRGRYRVWLALDRVTSSGAAMPLPDADAGDATIAMLIVSALAPLVLD